MTYIISEIGCNHQGSLNIAKALIRLAKQAGVDAVKFQLFHANRLISSKAPLCEYQKKSTDKSQLEMTRALELTFEQYKELESYANSLNLDCFATAFDEEYISVLAKHGQKIYKIPSGEITNTPYLRHLSAVCPKDSKILLSTGMSSIEEIGAALDELKGFKDIVILHCNTEYPTPLKDTNIRAILDIARHFPKYAVGFSDHSLGTIASIGAVALGASVLEKHFTLSRALGGVDDGASMEVHEFATLVTQVRALELALGSDKKEVTKSEAKNKAIARRSVIAKTAIKRGEIYSEENLTLKRPGSGIEPRYIYEMYGLKAEYDFVPDDIIVDSRFKTAFEVKK